MNNPEVVVRHLFGHQPHPQQTAQPFDPYAPDPDQSIKRNPTPGTPHLLYEGNINPNAAQPTPPINIPPPNLLRDGYIPPTTPPPIAPQPNSPLLTPQFQNDLDALMKYQGTI